MCGIAGIWTGRLVPAEAKRRVAGMTAALRHRGPDDEGIDVVSEDRNSVGLERRTTQAGPTVVFGHRRLSIQDLSAAGHQPMCDPDSGNWITYNGEIYNFPELRQELERSGHRFRTRCDTEVILKAYAEWGVGCWHRLRGIFAFGFWDARHQELHLVRDHLGVKPLYLAETGSGLAFASEVRAILAGDWVERRLSQEGLGSYLKYGSVQEPCTMVAGIVSLLPGHYLTVELSGVSTVRHYWKVDECLSRNWSRPPEAGDVFGQLEDSVRRQLISDVPVGVFLSGGIDSSVVAALAARAQPGSVRTFCIGTEEVDSDESVEAARTADHLGCKHATLMLDGQTVRSRLGAALSSYDQPSADGINTYFISMLVRQAGIKVALSGLGGDELFVGYGGFRKALAVERAGRMLRWIPSDLRRLMSDAVASGSPPGHASMGALAEALEVDLPAPYFASRLLFSRVHMSRFVSGHVPSGQPGQSWMRRESALAHGAQNLTAVDRVSYFELQTYLLSTLLRDSDQMSMAHGLELRVPLIDPELIEHVLPIPTSEKMAGGVSKRLLLDAMKGIIPQDVAGRRKRGFTLPFESWLLRDLKVTVEDTFASSSLRGPWEHKAFRKVWEDFGRGRVAWSRVLTLFVLENWLKDNRIGS